MKIEVLQTTIASKDSTGCFTFTYKAGEIYDIYDDLANEFIKNNWGKQYIENAKIHDSKNDLEIQDKAITNQNKRRKNKA